MKHLFLSALSALLLTVTAMQAQTFPIVFDFSSVSDTSGQYTGALCNGASLTRYASVPVLSLGDTDGYFDFGESFGDVIGSLSGSFAVSVSLFIPEATSIAANGNFIWCFAHNSASGYCFLSAKDTRYAITRTNWSGETSVNAASALQKGTWVNVTYVQNETSGTLYVAGESRVADVAVELKPADLGKTVQNYLGRSCYDGDAFLKNAFFADFRVYDKALEPEEVKTLAEAAEALNNLSDEEILTMDLEALTLPSSIRNLYEGVDLPAKGAYGSVITWKSENTELLSDEGQVVGLPAEQRTLVHLTATLTSGSQTVTKEFEVYVHQKDSPYSHYLFTFFPSNSDENIYYAVSDDGYTYTTINQGRAVVRAAGITQMGGLRDPHILRGEDGFFYMVATDMKCSLGWDSNRGMVLMRSRDLISWTSSKVHFPKRYAGTSFAKVTRVWAPETIYDPEAGKYMIYFSILTSDGSVPYDKVFYCYANENFTDLEGTPVYLYDRGSATIDMNIVFNENDSLYHAFYKNEGTGGICKVTAASLTAQEGLEGSQWSKPSGTLQQTTESVEGAGVFRLINSDDWILMYDCYMNGHYQFCSSPDLTNFTWRRNTATSGTFTPRHGTVIPITEEEYQLVLKLPGIVGVGELPETVAGTSAACDLSGRLVKGNSAVWKPGVYVLGGRKVVVR